jgi:hypothetical protein
MSESSRQAISEFLAQKRIAVVGVSRDPKDFNAAMFRALRQHGYDVVPVNPGAKEIEGVPCYECLQQIDPPVQAALVMTQPDKAETIVNDCWQAGIKRVWLYRAGGQGAVSPAAVAFCRQNGISVIPGFCPYMFLENTGWFHRLHGVLMKITGAYPS